MTASSIENLEQLLNKYFYSSTYKIIDGKVMYHSPLRENTFLKYSTKGQKHQIHTQ